MRYYYSLNNQALGPVPVEQLHQLYAVGTIKPDTLVAAEGASEWQAYSTLFPAAAGGSSTVGGSGPSTPPVSSPAVPPRGGMPAASSSAAVPRQDNKLVLISWILLGATALLSVIPIVGCVSWLLLIPVSIATVVMGLMILMRGGTRHGVMILVAALVVLPVIAILSPIVATLLFGAFTDTGKSSPAPSATVAPSVATAVSPGNEKPAEGSATAASPEGLPDAGMASTLVNDTMLNFKDAVNLGDFEEFYGTQLSTRWKQEITPENLTNTFKPFIDRKIDLTPIFSVAPVIEPARKNDDGFVVLQGHYPLPEQEVNVFFDLLYSQEKKWALSGINVRVKPTTE
jgi:hypothetical protein